MAIRHAILGLFHYRDMHGYKIKEQIEWSFGHVWSINYGQIYPNMKTLLDEGLISMTEVNHAGLSASGRKLYSITKQVKVAFRSWIMADPEKDKILKPPFSW